MSTVSRPRGPLPQRVYWVRRVLVLVLALLLVLAIGKLLGGGSDGSSDGSARTVSGDQTSSPTTSAATTYGPTVPVAPTTPGKRRGGTAPASTPAASTLPEPTGPCAEDDIVVTPVLGTPAGGADVPVRLDLTTRTSLACTVAVSPQTIALKIERRNGTFVWSTQDCPAAMPTTSVVARRDVAGSVDLTWSGHYANSGCTDAGKWAVPGWYHAIASVIGGSWTDAQFELGPAAAATITRTASPTQSATASGPASSSPATARSSATGRPVR